MSFQHTFYLKSNESKVTGLPDELDNRDYFWFHGARGFSDVVRRFSTNIDGEKFHFNSNQLMKFLAYLLDKAYEVYRPMKEAVDDFRDTLIYREEDLSADNKALESYAIIRKAYKEVDNIEVDLSDYFDSSYKLDKLIKGLTKFAAEMSEDDILVWDMG